MARWLAREWLRTRWAWVLALLSAGLGPVCSVASPIAILDDGSLSDAYLNSIWYLSAYFGALTGLLLFSRAGEVWNELSAATQAALGFGVIAGLGLLHGAMGVVPYRWLGAAGSTNWWGTCLCIAHWAALGSFLQRLPLQLSARCIALSLLGWWIPALLAGSPDWERLRWILSPARHLEPSSVVSETSLGLLVDTMPIVAWWIATALLPTRSVSRR
jgi:hypothetical protein